MEVENEMVVKVERDVLVLMRKVVECSFRFFFFCEFYGN